MPPWIRKNLSNSEPAVSKLSLNITTPTALEMFFFKEKCTCARYYVEESHQTDSSSCTCKLQFSAFFNTGDAMRLALTNGVWTAVKMTTSKPGPLNMHLILRPFFPLPLAGQKCSLSALRWSSIPQMLLRKEAAWYLSWYLGRLIRTGSVNYCC